MSCFFRNRSESLLVVFCLCLIARGVVSVGECCDALSAGSLRLCWRSCLGGSRTCMHAFFFVFFRPFCLGRSVPSSFACFLVLSALSSFLPFFWFFVSQFLVMYVWFVVTAPSYLHYTFVILLRSRFTYFSMLRVVIMLRFHFALLDVCFFVLCVLVVATSFSFFLSSLSLSSFSSASAWELEWNLREKDA